jgi:hypothetical protein
MNKYDIILISIVLVVMLLLIGVPSLINSNNASKALVYYDNKLIKTIDLSIQDKKEYTVKGYNGDIIIETQQNRIRVKKETSPLHLCSKQGWVSSNLEPIVCLPNKIVIKIISADDELDAVVR